MLYFHILYCIKIYYINLYNIACYHIGCSTTKSGTVHGVLYYVMCIILHLEYIAVILIFYSILSCSSLSRSGICTQFFIYICVFLSVRVAAFHTHIQMFNTTYKYIYIYVHMCVYIYILIYICGCICNVCNHTCDRQVDRQTPLSASSRQLCDGLLAAASYSGFCRQCRRFKSFGAVELVRAELRNFPPEP